jgi:hypothetical protein
MKIGDPAHVLALTILYQISTEREYLRGEVESETPGTFVDLDTMAYESVKKNWIEDGIWNRNGASCRG